MADRWSEIASLDDGALHTDAMSTVMSWLTPPPPKEESKGKPGGGDSGD